MTEPQGKSDPVHELRSALKKFGEGMKNQSEARSESAMQDPFGQVVDSPEIALAQEVYNGLAGELPPPDKQEIRNDHITWWWNVSETIWVRAILYTVDAPESLVIGKAGDYFVDVSTNPLSGGMVKFTNRTDFATNNVDGDFYIDLETLLALGKALMSAWAWRANWKKHVADLLIKSQRESVGTVPWDTKPDYQVVDIETNEDNPEPYISRADNQELEPPF